MPPQHWSEDRVAWIFHGTLSHRAEHGIYNTWFYIVCPGRLSGPCSHMHHRNTQPEDDNHTVSGHQLHAWVKLSNAWFRPILPTCMQSLALVTIRIPDLYRTMKLPVFDGVQEALERRNMQRKRKLEREKTTPVKKS